MSKASSQDPSSYWRDLSQGKGHLLVDKDNLPRYDGATEYIDQFEERVKTYHYSLKPDDRRLLLNRVKGRLTGRISSRTGWRVWRQNVSTACGTRTTQRRSWNIC
jgi:hypothetical protein